MQLYVAPAPRPGAPTRANVHPKRTVLHQTTVNETRRTTKSGGRPPRTARGARPLARTALRVLLALWFTAGAAILFSRWFVTHELPEHLSEYERLLTEATGVVVKADRIEVGFTLLRPVVVLEDVTLTRRGGPVSLHLPKIEAELAWGSLWHLEPRFATLILSNPELNVRRIGARTFDVAGFTIDLSSPREESKDTAGASVLGLLFAQGRLMIEGGSFRYTDETAASARTVSLERVNAAFEQRILDYRAAAQGEIRIDDAASAFDLRGRIEKHFFMQADDPLTWRGTAYADLPRTAVDRLLERIGLGGILRDGFGAAKLWADFEGDRITRLSGSVNVADVRAQIAPELAELDLPSLSGRFAFAQSASSLSFTASNFAFQTGEGTRFGPAELTAECGFTETRTPTGCRFSASEVAVGTIARLGPALPLPQAALDFLTEKAVSGRLSDVSAAFEGDWADPKNWTLSGNFTGLTLPAGDGPLPGFRNLSGMVRAEGAGAFTIELDTHYAALYFPQVFRTPRFDVTKLTGAVHVKMGDPLELAFTDVVLLNGDGLARAAGRWRGTGGPGEIDLSGTIERADGAAVHKYLPLVVGDPALDYVESAVIAGRGANGVFAVRGPLESFPWDGADRDKGEFRIEADVEAGSMDFMPSHAKSADGGWVRAAEWPVLTDIRGHLAFVGNRMTITGKSARSQQLSASKVKVEIADFTASPPVLTVDGTVTGDLGAALAYLGRAKFLRDAIGTPFAQSKGSGPVSAAISLHVPLGPGDKTSYTVTADLSKGRFTYLPILPEALDLTGRLVVASEGISTPKPFAGRTAAGPLKVTAASDAKAVRLDIHAESSAEDFERLVDHPFLAPWFREFSGAAPVRAEVFIPWAAGAPFRLEAESSLEGVASHLPAPLSKTAAEKLPAKLSYRSGGGSTALEFTTAPLVNVALAWEKDRLSHGFVGVGAPMRRVDSGFEAVVKTGAVDLTAWAQAWERAGAHFDAAQRGAGAAPKPAPLTRVDFAADDLVWKGRSFGGVDATWLQLPGLWHLRTQGPLASGQVEYLEEAPGRTPKLTVKLGRLYVPAAPAAEPKDAIAHTAPAQPSGTSGEGSSVLNALNAMPMLPDLSVVVDDLRWGERRIGKLEATAHNLPMTALGREWRLDELVVRNAGATLTSSGGWLRPTPEEAGTTKLKAALIVRDAGDMLSSLAFDDVLRGAPGRADLELSWAGRPSAFSLRTLSGPVSMELGAGQLLQVEPGAGRLLSLLSMQHLLRRLTLDFRDVLAKGLRFDSFNAQSRLESGVLRVEKTALAGSAATVVTSGDVDLVNNILDLKALVLPSINAEGPSLALAIANPAVGIGTLIAQWVLKDQISNFLSTEYEVKGSLDDPAVTKIASPINRTEKTTEKARDEAERAAHPGRREAQP